MNFAGGASADLSWVYLILFAIFFTASLRVRGNFKFAGAFFRDAVAVRERENIFDATVRETSFILLALLLSGCSMGVLLCVGARHYGALLLPGAHIPGLSLPDGSPLLDMGVCMLIACAYIGVMWFAYFFIGKVFSDDLHTSMWVRGFTSGMALASVLFFPLALAALSYPAHAGVLAATGLLMLILVKCVFVVKGFRIFFTESSLWVVFLYYLCSLEIIPLLIIFGLACSLVG